MERRFPDKEFMPIAIEVGQKKVLLIGGGRIALQKVQVLSRYAKNIHVLAPDILDEIRMKAVTCTRKPYSENDLEGVFIVYACTNNRSLNEQVQKDCRIRGILINVVDNPALCDFVTPAIYKKECVSVAVTSNAQSSHISIQVRNKIKNFLENDTSDPL